MTDSLPNFALQNFLASLVRGESRTGLVVDVQRSGVFVDLGGVPDYVEGFISLDELSWYPFESVDEVVEVGQKITVVVLEPGVRAGRAQLSLKATQEDPFGRFAAEHAVGEVLSGQVTGLTAAGAVVRLAAGVYGLLPAIELVMRPAGLYEQICVRVVEISRVRRRVGLAW